MYYARTPKERMAAKARRGQRFLSDRAVARVALPKKKKRKPPVHQPIEAGKSIQHIRNRTGGRSRKVRRGA